MLDSAAPSQVIDAGAVRSEGTAAAWLRRNVHVVIVAAVYVCALFAAGAQEFVQDTWLTLSGGRDVVAHGLPWHERLTVLNHGREWVDQQWLGKVLLFEVAGLGGLRLLLVVHVAAVLAGFVGAMVVARRRGASDAAVFWVVAATFAVAPWAWQLRVQSLAYVLFVALAAVLSDNGGAITRKTWLAVPILVIWANIHGSVTLGVALAVVAALLRLRRQPFAASLLALSCTAALFASPYGLHLVHYYRALLLNSALADYVDEWRPSAFPAAIPFFALAAAAIWLVARNARALSMFERAALLITGMAGVMAIRGIVWFALTVVLLLPKTLDAERKNARASSVRLLRPLAVVCCAFALFSAAFALTRLTGALAKAYPPEAAAAVNRAHARDPSRTVFASERYANWLLWRDPRVAGSLVYDVRFELFSRRQFEDLARFHSRLGRDWMRITHGARLLVLDLDADRRAARALRRQPHMRVLFEGDDVIVLLRDTRA
jgi:hypothetical protein